MLVCPESEGARANHGRLKAGSGGNAGDKKSFPENPGLCRAAGEWGGSGGGDSSGGLGAGAGQEPGIALVHRPLCGLAGLYFLSSEAGATATCPPVHVRFP